MRGVWRLSPSSEDISPESEEGENAPNKGDGTGRMQERELVPEWIMAGPQRGWHRGREDGGGRREEKRTGRDGIY